MPEIDKVKEFLLESEHIKKNIQKAVKSLEYVKNM